MVRALKYTQHLLNTFPFFQLRCFVITNISTLIFFLKMFPNLSTHVSERQGDRFSLESSPRADLNPGRDVNNFPSLYFPPPFVAVLVLSCCLLFCSSGALRGDLICASLLNPPLPKQHCIYLTKIATSGWKNPRQDKQK